MTVSREVADSARWKPAGRSTRRPRADLSFHPGVYILDLILSIIGLMQKSSLRRQVRQ